MRGHNSASFGETLYPESERLPSDYETVKFVRMDMHLNDYIEGTDGMRAEEEGIYIRFLVRLYRAGKPFEDDDRNMARLMDLDIRAWRRIKSALVAQKKIIIWHGSLTNERFEKERLKRAAFLKQAAGAAKKGWRERTEKAQPEDTSPELRPNFSPKFPIANAELSPKSGDKPLKNNELDDGNPYGSGYTSHSHSLKERGERDICPSEGDGLPSFDPASVEVNGTAIKGPGFRVPYATIEALAGAKGIGFDQAKQIAIGEAYSWAANVVPRDPAAKLSAALAAHLADANKKPPKPKRDGYSENFEEFWKIYPRKEAKGAASAAWERLLLPQKRRAYAAARQQAPMLTARMNEKGQNLCPHAATWLNQGRFDDDQSVPASKAEKNPWLVMDPEMPLHVWQDQLRHNLAKGRITADEAKLAGLL